MIDGELPISFNTYDIVNDDEKLKRIDNLEEYIRNSEIEFAIEIVDRKPVFKYENFAKYIVDYWRKKIP